MQHIIYTGAKSSLQYQINSQMRDISHLDHCHYQCIFINLSLFFLSLVSLHEYFLPVLKLSFKFMLSSKTMCLP